MKFGHIEVYCRDTQVARTFYETVLGCQLVAEQPGGLFWLQLDEQEFLLRPGGPSPAPANYEAAATGFVLYTDDLSAMRDQLTARGLQFAGYVDSEKCLTFQDPDGNWFQLVDPHDH